MLSSVLGSQRAIQVNIAIMRAFVKLRETMTAHTELAHRIEALERMYGQHDEDIQAVFDANRSLLEPRPIPLGAASKSKHPPQIEPRIR